jgi:hypothetical protein
MRGWYAVRILNVTQCFRVDNLGLGEVVKVLLDRTLARILSGPTILSLRRI